MEAEIKQAKEDVEAIGKDIKAKMATIQEAVKDKAAAQTVEDLKTDFLELKSKFDNAATVVDELQKAREKDKQRLDEAPESLISQVGRQINKGFLKETFRQKEGKELEIDLQKAATPMSSAYALTGSNTNLMRAFEIEAGVSKAPVNELLVQNLIQIGTTNSHTVYWTERALLEGAAAQTAEAAKFPLVSAKYEVKSANSKKTAAYAKITEEMLEDVDYILSETQDEIVSGPAGIKYAVENQILTGAGTGENHLGLFTLATAFAKPTGFQTIGAGKATNYDVLAAALLQLKKANFNATAIVVNPSDAVNMELIKNANGDYLIPPFFNNQGMLIKGVKIVDSNFIAEGSFLAADFQRAKLFIKRHLTLKFFDQNEDDALYDMKTITGSIRAVFRVKTPDRVGFVKGTFATAKTALETA